VTPDEVKEIRKKALNYRLMLEIYDLAKDGLKYRSKK
jgi:hypothetical protein